MMLILILVILYLLISVVCTILFICACIVSARSHGDGAALDDEQPVATRPAIAPRSAYSVGAARVVNGQPVVFLQDESSARAN
jgi:hypothetical protein